MGSSESTLPHVLDQAVPRTPGFSCKCVCVCGGKRLPRHRSVCLCAARNLVRKPQGGAVCSSANHHRVYWPRMGCTRHCGDRKGGHRCGRHTRTTLAGHCVAFQRLQTMIYIMSFPSMCYLVTRMLLCTIGGLGVVSLRSASCEIGSSSLSDVEGRSSAAVFAMPTQ